MSVTPDCLYALNPGDKIIDVSHYQGVALLGNASPIESDLFKFVAAMRDAKLAGARAVGIKFTEGLLGKDAFAPYFARACEAVELDWFPYHRFVSGGSQVLRGLAQARQLYTAAYQDVRLTKAGPPVLDWENIGNEPMLHPYDAVTFLEYMGHHTGMNPVVYSSKHYLDEQTYRIGGWPNQEWVLDYRFWVASYPKPLLSTSKPLMPTVYVIRRESAFMWQNQSDQPFSGLKGPVDQSVRL